MQETVDIELKSCSNCPYVEIINEVDVIRGIKETTYWCKNKLMKGYKKIKHPTKHIPKRCPIIGSV